MYCRKPFSFRETLLLTKVLRTWEYMESRELNMLIALLLVKVMSKTTCNMTGNVWGSCLGVVFGGRVWGLCLGVIFGGNVWG